MWRWYGDVHDEATVRRALKAVHGVVRPAAEVSVGRSMDAVERCANGSEVGTAVRLPLRESEAQCC